MRYSDKKTHIFIAICSVFFFNACEDKNRVLNKEEAMSVIRTYIKNPLMDTIISMEDEEQKIDLLGKYDGYFVAIDYDKPAEMYTPKVSTEVDYYMGIPLGNEAFLRAAMETLSKVDFLPVLAAQKSLGNLPMHESIKASLEVRHALLATCSFLDDNHRTYSSFTQAINHNQFVLPENNGFNLQAARYVLNCLFTDEHNKSTEEIGVLYFSIIADEKPQYKGGIKNTTCVLGHKIPLKARFSTAYQKSFQISYYDNDVKLEDGIFVCEGIGRHEIMALGVDKFGERAQSPLFEFTVEDIPAAFFPGAKRVHTTPRVKIELSKP